jgi:RelB antitoxin of RelBE toxin-antitoxin system
MDHSLSAFDFSWSLETIQRRIVSGRVSMEELKKNYIVDEHNRRVAVQLDIETFNKIEEVIEDYALARLMEEYSDDEALETDEALAYYGTLEKAE